MTGPTTRANVAKTPARSNKKDGFGPGRRNFPRGGGAQATRHADQSGMTGNISRPAPIGLQLPICLRWRCFCDARAFDKVGEAREAAPYDGGAWWRIGAAIEIAAEPRDAPDIEIEVARELLLAFWRRALEQLAFDVGEDGSRRCFRRIAAEHRQP